MGTQANQLVFGISGLEKCNTILSIIEFQIGFDVLHCFEKVNSLRSGFCHYKVFSNFIQSIWNNGVLTSSFLNTRKRS